MAAFESRKSGVGGADLLVCLTIIVGWVAAVVVMDKSNILIASVVLTVLAAIGWGTYAFKKWSEPDQIDSLQQRGPDSEDVASPDVSSVGGGDGFYPVEPGWDKSDPFSEETFKYYRTPIMKIAPHVSEVAIKVFDRAGSQIALVRVMNVHDDCYWAFGSDERLIGPVEAECELSELLQDDLYRDRFEFARDLLFVGLDSFPRSASPDAQSGGEPQPQLKTPISARRAKKLAAATFSAYPQFLATKRFWTVDLGMSKVEASPDTFQERRQRSAAIIGMDIAESSLAREVLLRRALQFVDYADFDLSRYSNSSDPLIRQCESGGAELKCSDQAIISKE